MPDRLVSWRRGMSGGLTSSRELGDWPLERIATTEDGNPPLIVPRRLRDEMVVHVRSSLPHEGCGLLAISNGVEGATVVHFYPGENIDESPTRFTMKPEQVLTALLDIEHRHWHLGAIIHSHPRGPAEPSATDLAEARYPEALLGIIGYAMTAPDLRFWRLLPAPSAPPTEVAYQLVADNLSPGMRQSRRNLGGLPRDFGPQ